MNELELFEQQISDLDKRSKFDVEPKLKVGKKENYDGPGFVWVSGLITTEIQTVVIENAISQRVRRRYQKLISNSYYGTIRVGEI